MIDNGITVCASATRENTNQTDIEESKTMEMQLLGLLAWLRNDQENAESWLQKSVELEESLSYSYGPPFIQKPTHELYAEWLMDQHRPEDALKQYTLALKRGTNRSLILKGIQRAKLSIKNITQTRQILNSNS